MTMTANGLAKLIEECGELTQVAGKKLAYFHTDEHPDGGPPLLNRMADEMADVIAAIHFVAANFGIDPGKVQDRAIHKLKLFGSWHADETNNTHGVDQQAKPEVGNG